MSDLDIAFEGELWMYQGKGAWFFITLPKDVSERIKFFTGPRRGWGSVRVSARIGKTMWKTSIFPDKKAGAYLLPVKADVRAKESLEAGRAVSVKLGIDL